MNRGSTLLVMSVLACCVTACDSGVAAQSDSSPTSRPAATMKITFKLQDKTLTGTLHDTPTARDFASMLPLTLTLEDYARAEKIAYLPRKLTTQGAPAGAGGSAGAIAYYAPWGNLAMIYKDFRPADGLIVLGEIDGDVKALSGPGSLEVTITALDKHDAGRTE